MDAPPHNSWLHRFTVLTAVATFVLLGAGGLVTSHGVGMAVPDWPNTYGYNMFLFPYSQWVGGIFYEHSHRLVASGVGLLTAILAGWLWQRETRGRTRGMGLAAVILVTALLGVRQMPVYVTLAALAPLVMVAALWQFKKNPDALRWLGVMALAAVILQGVLGGLRVVWFKDELGIFHATLAQLFFVLVCVLALFTSHWWLERRPPARLVSENGSQRAETVLGVPRLRRLALVTTLLILLQLILGATMRHQHAGLAIPDFPLAYGKLWPAMDAESVAGYNQRRMEVTAAHPITAAQIGLQMAHRLMAVLILLGVVVVVWRARSWNAGLRPGSFLKTAINEPGRRPALLLRRLSFAWLGLILVQAGLGAWTLWSNKAADVATAHVLVGALSLVTGALWCIIDLRCPTTWTERKPVSTNARTSGETPFEARSAAVVGK